MNKIVEWLNANKLSINPCKTKFIIFKSKNKSLNQEIPLKINNNIIKQASYVKFLGVLIDHDFSWKNHISSVQKNIIKSAGLIAKLRHFTNKNSLKLVYYALVFPHVRKSSLGKYVPNQASKVTECAKENCSTN